MYFAVFVYYEYRRVEFAVAAQSCSAQAESKVACALEMTLPREAAVGVWASIVIGVSLMTVLTVHELPALLSTAYVLVGAVLVDLRHGDGLPCAAVCAEIDCGACAMLDTAAARQSIVLALCVAAGCDAAIALSAYSLRQSHPDILPKIERLIDF